MDIAFQEKEQHVEIQINGDLVVQNAHKALDALLSRDLAGMKEIRVNLEHVSGIDSAGLQVLIVLKRHFEGAAVAFRLIHHPKPVIALFDLYGMIAHFGDKVQVPKHEMDQYQFAYGVRKSEIGHTPK